MITAMHVDRDSIFWAGSVSEVLFWIIKQIVFIGYQINIRMLKLTETYGLIKFWKIIMVIVIHQNQ